MRCRWCMPDHVPSTFIIKGNTSVFNEAHFVNMAGSNNVDVNRVCASVCQVAGDRCDVIFEALPRLLPGRFLPDRIIEIKGVHARRNEKVGHDLADWLELDENGLVQLKPHSKHWYQVQGQLGIVGRDLCDLVVFTDVNALVISVRPVPNYYAEHMVPKLRAFYDKYVAREIVTAMRR